MNKQHTASGAKAHQRTDSEWRAKPYSDWHRTLDRKFLMTDVDFVEWRYRDGKLDAAAVIEGTRVDSGGSVTQNYLDAIVSRFEERDFQAKAARKVADALGTKAWIVLFRETCKEFWVYNLTDRRGWFSLCEKKMVRWLNSL